MKGFPKRRSTQKSLGLHAARIFLIWASEYKEKMVSRTPEKALVELES